MFHLQSIRPVHAGCVLHNCDCRNRCRIISPCLCHDHSLGRFKSDIELNRPQTERRALSLARPVKVELALHALQHKIFGSSLQAVALHNGVQSAFFEGLVSFDMGSTADPDIRIVRPDQSGQTDRTTKTRNNAEFNLRESHNRFRGCHAIIGCNCQLEPAAEGDTIDRTDGRKGEILYCVEDSIGLHQPGHNAFFAASKNAGELCDVSSHDKSALSAGKDKPFSIGFRQQIDRIAQLFKRVPVKFVH